MSLVLDNSVTMRWFFGDGMPADRAYAAAVAHALRQDSALVPTIWSLEVANVLCRAEARGLVNQDRSDEFLRLLRAMRISSDPETARHALGDTLTLARAHALSAYDAAYLELALRQQLPLATLDVALRQACGRAGVTVFAA